jgi:hypothetical protein
LALAALLLVTQLARAAEIRIEDNGAISVSGELVANDGDTFQRAVGQTKVPPQDIMVFLNSPGGDAATVISIGDYIHHTGIATTVLPGAECVSTCALIWLGGAHRFASRTSKIAFHGLYNGHTLEVDQKLAVSYAIVGAYLAHLGIGYDGIVWMISSPPGTANALSFEKAKELGIDVASWEELLDAAKKLQGKTPSKEKGFAVYTTTTELTLRSDADPRAAPIYRIPRGEKVYGWLEENCKWWMGSGRGSQDADNLWCPVWYDNQKGWANAAYLVTARGEILACSNAPWRSGCVRRQDF